MKPKLEKHKNRQEIKNASWKVSGFHFMLLITLIAAIVLGYAFETFLDHIIGLPPKLTYIGLVGSAVAVLLIYKKKGSGRHSTKEVKVNVGQAWPVIEVNVEDVRKAIRVYSDQLPKGVYRTILVNEDHSIDFDQLASILKGIPSRKFYMSKETYDIFEENEKEIAITIDNVQKAVDLYVKEHKQFPMLPYDPLKRVNYFQLLQAHCLDAQPDIELYITDYDGLVTHKKPKKNSTDN